MIKLELRFVNLKDSFGLFINLYLDNDRRLFISQESIRYFKDTSGEACTFKTLVEQLKNFHVSEELINVVIKIINFKVKLLYQLLGERFVPFVCKHNFVILKHNYIRFLVLKDTAGLFFLFLAVFFFEKQLDLLSVCVIIVKFSYKDRY